MSRRDDAALLRDIRAYGRQASAFAAGRIRADLDGDAMLREALVRELEVVGEAAGRLSVEFREAHPEVPWGDWAGLRNRLIHGYFAVDLDIVWGILTLDLPALLVVVEACLPPEAAPA